MASVSAVSSPTITPAVQTAASAPPVVATPTPAQPPASVQDCQAVSTVHGIRTVCHVASAISDAAGVAGVGCLIGACLAVPFGWPLLVAAILLIPFLGLGIWGHVATERHFGAIEDDVKAKMCPAAKLDDQRRQMAQQMVAPKLIVFTDPFNVLKRSLS